MRTILTFLSGLALILISFSAYASDENSFSHEPDIEFRKKGNKGSKPKMPARESIHGSYDTATQLLHLEFEQAVGLCRLDISRDLNPVHTEYFDSFMQQADLNVILLPGDLLEITDQAGNSYTAFYF